MIFAYFMLGIFDTEEEGHTVSGKKAAGASVEFDCRGGVTGLNTGKTGPAAGHQKEEHTTKHPSDQWQVRTYHTIYVSSFDCYCRLTMFKLCMWASSCETVALCRDRQKLAI